MQQEQRNVITQPHYSFHCTEQSNTSQQASQNPASQCLTLKVTGDAGQPSHCLGAHALLGNWYLKWHLSKWLLKHTSAISLC